MPLYEYECEKCGDHFEVIQKFADEPLQVHEKCGGPVHRLVSAPAFHLKGSGWYATDYAKGNRASNGDAKKSTDKADGNGSATADKPAAKTETSAPAATTTTSPSTSDKK